jgi:ABC-type amino acid transport substrate-binding protein
MAKHICFKIIIAFMLSGLWLGHGDTPALAADVKFSKGSTLEGILKRGELRIGLEVGYMPFEMIDKRSGLRQKEIRHGDLRRKGRQLSLMGFDIDVGLRWPKRWGLNRYLLTPCGPASFLL